jgi:hypothetical protein
MAIDLTGIQNVGEFYSHHYLDALLENDLKGLFAKWREQGNEEGTPDRRLNACATAYFTAKSRAIKESKLAARYAYSHGYHVQLLEALGYPYNFHVRYLLEGSSLPLLSALERDGRPYLWIVETPFAGQDDASPLDQPLIAAQYPRLWLDEMESASHGTNGLGTKSEDFEAVIPTDLWHELIGEIFRVEEPPRWLLLLAGRHVYLADRTKWGRGQYLLFDLDEIYGRREGSTLRATAALLAREALVPDDGVPVHDTLDENSHKHAFAVSEDLKYGVRQAVELLANEYVWYQRNVGKQALFQDDELASKLRREALTYLYRLLFLFYAEARGGELDLVPMKSEAYRSGYSLEALRDLEQAPLTTPQAQDGYFFHESLEHLFRLMNRGFGVKSSQLAFTTGSGNGDGQSSNGAVSSTGPYDDYGFRMEGLHSNLFDPAHLPTLGRAKFRNVVLQQIVQALSLSQEGKGRFSTRGRISYAQLGINQLGAVYEGLLSYTGFFAQEPLYEVKPAGADAGKEDVQTYFVPEADLHKYTPDEFVYEDEPDGTRRRKRHERGRFIFHLAGRDREKSASYYTPEVLTRCVVKYSLKELLPGLSADEILQLTICEPAMGSGAFINEAINQLADAYLDRKQNEVGERLAPDQYRDERQRVKAYFASHNVYGVDLNPTAVELAYVSIWLNAIYQGAAAPWYAPRLAVGNSLIGARRQVYSAEDVKSAAFLSKAPDAVALNQARPRGSIYHFLLPDKGMAAFDSDKVIKELVPDAVAAIKEWRKEFTKKLSANEIAKLQAISDRIDDLWQRAVQERQTLLARTATPIQVWGQPAPANLPTATDYIAAKDKELETCRRATGPYAQLKLVMDYWCSLWFWPIPAAETLPSRTQYLNDLDAILQGEDEGFGQMVAQAELFGTGWDDTLRTRPKQAGFGDIKAANVDELCRENERLAQACAVAQQQRFHHWELAFGEVFAERGGFDLIVGNPPWVKMSFDAKGVLSEYEPLLVLRGMSASDVASQLQSVLSGDNQVRDYLHEFAEMNGSLEFLDGIQNYPLLKGMQTNLYKCFITRAWEIGSGQGIAGFLHPEGIYDDTKGGQLRSAIYPRLKGHFQFQNALFLFAEVHDQTLFSINVYKARPGLSVQFNQMANLYHPRTVDLSFAHDGSGATPGMRDTSSNWEVGGHLERIVRVDAAHLDLFAELYDMPGTPAHQARLPAVHSNQIVRVLHKFSEQSSRLSDLSEHFALSDMWHETGAQRDGTIRRETRFPNYVGEWLVSGPHFFVATPLNKTPNEGCRHNQDYSDIDLTLIPDDYLPRTNYVPACSPEEYQRRVPKWNGKKLTGQYRFLYRRMLSRTGERTLVGALFPPGIGHTNTMLSVTFDSQVMLVILSCLCSSVPFDFFIKSTGKADLYEDTLAQLPFPTQLNFEHEMMLRTLSLNCLTIHYSNLWTNLYTPMFNQDKWSKHDIRLSHWADLTPYWTRNIALRTPFERRQALVEIDVLAAMALGLTLDELLTIYRVQFPVLQKYDRRLRFDQRGMEVPVKTVQGEFGVDEGHEKFREMVPPFTTVDREADYRQAWAHFAARLQQEGKGT